jgi:hypothetical protein
MLNVPTTTPHVCTHNEYTLTRFHIACATYTADSRRVTSLSGHVSGHVSSHVSGHVSGHVSSASPQAEPTDILASYSAAQWKALSEGMAALLQTLPVVQQPGKQATFGTRFTLCTLAERLQVHRSVIKELFYVSGSSSMVWQDINMSCPLSVARLRVLYHHTARCARQAAGAAAAGGVSGSSSSSSGGSKKFKRATIDTAAGAAAAAGADTAADSSEHSGSSCKRSANSGSSGDADVAADVAGSERPSKDPRRAAQTHALQQQLQQQQQQQKQQQQQQQKQQRKTPPQQQQQPQQQRKTPPQQQEQQLQHLQLQLQQQQQLPQWFNSAPEPATSASDDSSTMALVAVWKLPQNVAEAISQANLAEFFTRPTGGLPGYPGYRIPEWHVTFAGSEAASSALVAFPM